MDNQVFDTYFKRTVWHSGCHIPSDEELCKMEDKCIERLIELSQTNIPTYKYTFSKYGNDVISRIGFFKKELLFEKNEGIEKLLFSAERFRKKFKNLDRNLYEQSFRVNIERGKGGITWANVLMRRHKAKQPVQPTNNTENKEVEPSVVEREEREEKLVKVISGTQGLADYLGCSKSMAFGIISKGVLKDIGVQYMVGKCWKFNREKLDKYLKEHPDLLANVRCNR